MVRIADRLRARVPGAVVHAVGEGPLERQARELGAGLDGGLRFHPVQPQGMSSWYRAADVIQRLTLQMNRARQAVITKELMEIVSGKEALSAG